jgi:hypothetical protein
MPAQAGIEYFKSSMDSGFRRNDGGLLYGCLWNVRVNMTEIKRTTKRSKTRNPFPPSLERKGFSLGRTTKILPLIVLKQGTLII